ncbi:MAG: hypothetical protein IPM79_00475 [Polyangiaceae bacterium]|nr:hypothetical protein [Polyangiaceae bacterium]
MQRVARAPSSPSSSRLDCATTSAPSPHTSPSACEHTKPIPRTYTVICAGVLHDTLPASSASPSSEA